MNEDRKSRMADKVIEAAGGDIRGKTIAILGVAFKPNTDDMRDAPSLTIIPVLQQAGAKIKAFDPESMESAKGLIEDITWCKDSYDAATDADILVILTEWNQFRGLDGKRLRELMSGNIVADLRNIYVPDQMKALGFDYISVGR